MINLDDLRNPDVVIQGGSNAALNLLGAFVKLQNRVDQLTEENSKLHRLIKSYQQHVRFAEKGTV